MEGIRNTAKESFGMSDHTLWKENSIHYTVN